MTFECEFRHMTVANSQVDYHCEGHCHHVTRQYGHKFDIRHKDCVIFGGIADLNRSQYRKSD